MRTVYFNGKDLSELLYIKDIYESIMAPLTVDKLKLNNGIGSHFIRQTLEERTIEITAEFIADTLEERREKIDELARILYTEKTVELVLDGERKYQAVFEGDSNISNQRWDGSLSLKFIAPNPIAYGNRVFIPIQSGKSYYNAGTYQTRGVITITATASTVIARLINGQSYEYVKVTGVNVGESVEIDMGNEVVKVNGTVSMKKMDALGDFFPLKPGNFKIEISGGSAVLRFAERWL